MSFDLVAWKWSAGSAGETNPQDVYEALLDEREHPAVGTFDEQPIVQAIKERFGDVNGDEGSPFLYFTGHQCLIFNVSVDREDQIVQRLKTFLEEQTLYCYDPQLSP